jgi:hypothetical protein
MQGIVWNQIVTGRVWRSSMSSRTGRHDWPVTTPAGTRAGHADADPKRASGSRSLRTHRRPAPLTRFRSAPLSGPRESSPFGRYGSRPAGAEDAERARPRQRWDRARAYVGESNSGECVVTGAGKASCRIRMHRRETHPDDPLPSGRRQAPPVRRFGRVSAPSGARCARGSRRARPGGRRGRARR